MTLQGYLKIFRQRWKVIATCAFVAGAVMWIITPANPSVAKSTTTYTATATLLVESADPQQASVPMGRIPLFLTTGEIPQEAAADVGYTGDPALLAADLTVTPDFQAQALTIAASGTDGAKAAATANAFADQAVKFFADGKETGGGSITLSVLQPATPIPEATSDAGGFVVPPGRWQRTVLATNLGLLVGLALALILDRLDSRLRGSDEIGAALRLPVIAEVPKLTRDQRENSGIIVAQDPLSMYADGYRAARTALMHTQSGQVPIGHEGSRRPPVGRGAPAGARIILVTSAHESDGKTTTVANLAASFAETGQRVLVLDADLRSPDTHRAFDVPQGAGISDYVVDPGSMRLESLLRPTSVPSVEIVTAGTRLAHPASLSSRLGQLLDEARHLADVILVDSAPLLDASDVFDLLPVVDAVLIVARVGRLTQAQGNRVADLLSRFRVPVGGAVLVGASIKRRGGYGYGQEPGDGDTRRQSRKGWREVPVLQRIASSAPWADREHAEAEAHLGMPEDGNGRVNGDDPREAAASVSGDAPDPLADIGPWVNRSTRGPSSS
jgi:capsular exopolysaccharide synthesis family protein